MRNGIAPLVVMALLGGGTVGAAGAQRVVPASLSTTLDQGKVNGLAAAWHGVLANMPRGAMQADAEAALVFAIDQAGQSQELVLAALYQINGSDLSPAAQRALAAVKGNRARAAQRGTGSIAGGPTIALAFGAAPSVTGGSNSGSSDYGR